MRFSKTGSPPSNLTFPQRMSHTSSQRTLSKVVSPLKSFCWPLINCSTKPTFSVKHSTPQTCSPDSLSSHCLPPRKLGDIAQTALSSFLSADSIHSSKTYSTQLPLGILLNFPDGVNDHPAIPTAPSTYLLVQHVSHQFVMFWILVWLELPLV